MPVFDMIEMVLAKKLRFPPGLPVRLVARTAYVGNISDLISNSLLHAKALAIRKSRL
jgi:hypothetical protein